MSAEQDLANANVQIANLISEVTRFRDAAMGINNIWPTITDGRNNTADGKYFSVPGDGAYLKLYRRAGTSQTLIAQFPDRAQVQGIIDVLAGRGVIGSGDLMAERAYGLGSPSGPDIDANAAGLKTQLGRFISGTLDGDSWHGLHLSRVLDAQSGQFAIRDGSANDAAFRGRGSNGIWRTWSRLYHNDNILAAVTQENGRPTGGQFEAGINANGRYLKLPDGSVFARTLAVATYTDSARLSFAWSFPVSLSASNDYSWSACIQQRNPSNTVEGIPRSKIQVSQVTESSHSSNTLGLEVLAPAGTFEPGDFVWLSIRVEGRWY